MIVSTKGRYALRVMIDLAQHQAEGYIPLKEIAERQDISEKYLESITKLLVKEKLLCGLRGKGGGYRLTKSPDAYRVGEILRLTENGLCSVSCLEPDAPPCPRKAYCHTLPMWEKLDLLVNNYLDSISIADLVSAAPSGNDYVI